MFIDMLNNTLVHQKNMWSPRHVRMDSHRENELICAEAHLAFARESVNWRDVHTIFSVKIVEVVPPDILHVPRISWLAPRKI